MQSGSAQSTRPSSSSSMPLLQISTPGVTHGRLPKHPGSAQSTRPLQLSSTPSLQISGWPGAQPPKPPIPRPPTPWPPKPFPPKPPTPRPPSAVATDPVAAEAAAAFAADAIATEAAGPIAAKANPAVAADRLVAVGRVAVGIRWRTPVLAEQIRATACHAGTGDDDQENPRRREPGGTAHRLRRLRHFTESRQQFPQWSLGTFPCTAVRVGQITSGGHWRGARNPRHPANSIAPTPTTESRTNSETKSTRG